MDQLTLSEINHTHLVHKGRLAPSPTGRLHLGNAFAFLTAWLNVRSNNGRLVLRIEDIDPDRSRPAFTEGILEDLHWLGLDWDEGPPAVSPFGPYLQSQRLGLYAAAAQRLTEIGLLYPCFCTRKELRLLASAPHIGDEGVPYPGTCRHLDAKQIKAFQTAGRNPCLRLNTDAAAAYIQKTENQVSAKCVHPQSLMFSFVDGVQGRQSFRLADCGGDFALCRSDGVYAYQLAVCVDDGLMEISEVIRGEDLLLSTPRQLLLFKLLNLPAPSYAHIPLLVDAKGERLAKRHAGLELKALAAAGISARQLVGRLGYMAGWLKKPQNVQANDLLDSFSLNSLKNRSLTTAGVFGEM